MPNGNPNLNSCRYIPIQKIRPLEIDWTQFKLIIWDLDGTLYDMGKIRRKIQLSSLLSIKRTKGILNYLYVIKRLEAERLKGEFKVSEYQKQFNQLQEFINSYLSPDLISGQAQEILDIARARDIKQIVISDFPIADKLKRLGLEKYFTEALGCADEVQCWKPHERIYMAMEDLLVESLPFVVIGDRIDTDGELLNLFVEKLSQVEIL